MEYMTVYVEESETYLFVVKDAVLFGCITYFLLYSLKHSLLMSSQY